MNKRSTVTINIPFREIEKIEIEEIVKQGATYRPVLCCVITTRVNDIGEKLCCKYKDADIEMPFFYGRHISSRRCRRHQEKNQKLQGNGNTRKV